MYVFQYNELTLENQWIIIKKHLKLHAFGITSKFGIFSIEQQHTISIQILARFT